MIIEIDIDILAAEMIRRGMDPETIANEDFTGWTNNLVDVLEWKFDLERLLREEIISRN